MRKHVLFTLLMASVVLPAPASPADKLRPAVHEEVGQAWDDLTREVREWFDRWRGHFNSGTSTEERPLISTILRNREKLGLSADQANNLEQLRNKFQKESIRKEADLRVAEMDLNSSLEAQPVDMRKVEEKIREIERLRADLRLARIRTIEKGKEQLTADQRKQLQDLLSDQRLTRNRPRGER
ncbi:MAG: Spy/CpxP family protein refolding chaperone [Candidatus Binatia bacterium]